MYLIRFPESISCDSQINISNVHLSDREKWATILHSYKRLSTASPVEDASFISQGNVDFRIDFLTDFEALKS